MIKNILDKTDFFANWLDSLDDENLKDAIDTRIANAEEGNFGDAKSVSKGVYEMRIHYGPGYRLYYCQRGRKVYLLLVGGDKSTQKRDVERAKVMKREIERSAK
jgi:putative addiction module killer protein